MREMNLIDVSKRAPGNMHMDHVVLCYGLITTSCIQGCFNGNDSPSGEATLKNMVK